MEGMELVERYIHEVGRRLPRKTRTDVEAELRSLIADALEARAATDSEGAPFTQEAQAAVLREFGPPAEVAAQYAPPHRYVIGPQLYTPYLITAASVAGAMAIPHLILLVIHFWNREPLGGELWQELARILVNYFNATFASLGVLTLVFALMDRFLPVSVDLEEDDQEWDPADLAPIEDPSRINLTGLVFSIAWCIVLLVVLNLFPEQTGFIFFRNAESGGQWVTTSSVLAPVFFATYLPLLNVQWGLSIVLNLILLRQRRWQLGTRLFDLGVAAFGIYILARMVAGPALLNTNASWLADLPVNDLGWTSLISLLSNMIRVALLIALIVSAIEAVKKGVDMIRFSLARPPAGVSVE